MRPAEASPCPDQARLSAFRRGELSGAEIDEIREHLAVCPVCEKQLAEVDRQYDTIASAFRDDRTGAIPLGATMADSAAAPPVPAGSAAMVTGMLVAGRYKLLEKIGEGGMGLVFKAEQVEPVRRRVALKLIKEGMDTRQVLARFEAERQALALMDHPNIARVLDAGATVTGRPYFVMELVQGVPITTYCDDHRLVTRDRLELFVMTCRAIQHAHQKGIIHRDIKPANVLVAQFDGRPVVKVIDFGIAKAVGQPLTDRTLVTNFGAVVGTVEYMSPEQAELNQLDIDTRSDVYALGVLLYELLTGSTPLDRQKLGKAAVFEMLRLVREEEPPRPSTRLSSSEALPSIAVRRGIEPARLAPLIRGDLDWIAMRALEKDRTRRYETANGLARDVERFLNDEPVEASPPSTGYRLGKFARKNRKALRVALAIVGTLILATLVSTWQAIRASHAEARERAQLANAEARYNLARAAIETFYTGVSEDVLLREPLMKDLRGKLLGAALQFYRRLQDQRERQGEANPASEVQAEVARGFERLADVTADVGDKREALAGYERALPIRRTLAASDPAQAGPKRALARLYDSLGGVFYDIGPPEVSADWYRRAAAEYRAVAGLPNGTDEDRLRAAAAQVRIAEALSTTVRTEEVIAGFDQAIAELRRLVQARPADFGTGRELAQALLKAGAFRLNGAPRPLEAIPLIDESNAIHARLAIDHGDDIKLRQDWAQGLRQAGMAREQTGPIEKTLPFYREALAAAEPVQRRYPTLSEVRRLLAEIRIAIGITLSGLPGRAREALVEYAHADAILEPLIAENPDVPMFRARLAASVCSQGLAFGMLGDSDAAVEKISKAIALRERLTHDQPTVEFFWLLLGDDHGFLGDIYRHAGRPVEALHQYRQAVAILQNRQATNVFNRLNLASWICGVAAHLDHDPHRPPRSVIDAERRALVTRALELLREVVAAGRHSPSSLTSDENFKILEPLPAYQLILMDMAFPDSPFAAE